MELNKDYLRALHSIAKGEAIENLSDLEKEFEPQEMAYKGSFKGFDSIGDAAKWVNVSVAANILNIVLLGQPHRYNPKVIKRAHQYLDYVVRDFPLNDS